MWHFFHRPTSRPANPTTLKHHLALESLESRTLLHGGLSGFVYVDGDADGARDTGESGIPGVVIELTGNATGGAAVTLSEMTDDAGAYSFTELDPGTYTITQRQPDAHLDGQDAITFAGAVAANDSFSNIVLAAEQVAADINFGERGLKPEFVSIRSFLASTPAPAVALREINAIAADQAGNSTLADSIRNGAGDTPDGGDEEDLFGPVTTGSFQDTDLLGIRTDLVSGAPPITAEHVSTAVSYAGFSNPPTYGPHHGPVNDAQGNSITPRPTGVYTTEQHDEDLVHNLEHGHVWISYNPTTISAADKAALEALVTNGGTNTGVILTPRSQNTTTIAVASWARLLTLGAFDEEQIRAFIETNRGHAPEGFIRSGQKGTGSGSETLDDGLLHTRTPLTAFAAVTPGSETDASLLGTRTDLVSGAPPVTERSHVTTAVDYTGFSNPPSYGPHHGVVQDDDGGTITPRPTGIYTTEQPDEDLVHNLEHGHVWISYDPALISATDKTALEQLITAGGTNNGVIMTPRAKNTSAIVLTSWIHQLSLNSFNATTIRNFIETNRGHSPEGFIPSGQKTAASETLDDDLDHTP